MQTLSTSPVCRMQPAVNRRVISASGTIKKRQYDDLKRIRSTNPKTRATAKVRNNRMKILVPANRVATSIGAQSPIQRSPVKKPDSTVVRASVRPSRVNSTSTSSGRPIPTRQPVQLRLPMELEPNSLKVPGTDIVISPIALNIVDHIVRAFNAEGVDKLGVSRLLKRLNSNPDSGSIKPWAIYNKGKPMSARQLNAILMTELGIHSFDLRITACKVVKGLHVRIFKLLQVAFSGKTATPPTSKFLSKFT